MGEQKPLGKTPLRGNPSPEMTYLPTSSLRVPCLCYLSCVKGPTRAPPGCGCQKTGQGAMYIAPTPISEPYLPYAASFCWKGLPGACIYPSTLRDTSNDSFKRQLPEGRANAPWETLYAAMYSAQGSLQGPDTPEPAVACIMQAKAMRNYHVSHSFDNSPHELPWPRPGCKRQK